MVTFNQIHSKTRNVKSDLKTNLLSLDVKKCFYILLHWADLLPNGLAILEGVKQKSAPDTLHIST